VRKLGAANAVRFLQLYGELRAGAVRPGPMYARIRTDQEMKKKMGF
jgi:hypothetical protein